MRFYYKISNTLHIYLVYILVIFAHMKYVYATPSQTAHITQHKDITILPINNAKFLAGQRFDFLIEIKDPTLNPANASSTIQVTINDKNIINYFNKKPKIWRDGDILSYRIDSISFNDTGFIKVKVKTPNSLGIATYEVVDNKANRKAKNVILLIGDGMSLQAKQMARILSKGISEGKYNDVLEMEKLDRMALITTSGYVL